MTRTAAALAAFVFVTAAGAAHADSAYPNPIDDRIRLSLGAAYYSTSTAVRVDSSSGATGTYLNAEKDLGLAPHSFEPRFELLVRAGERHRIRFDYFSLVRNRTTTLNLSSAQTPIVFRDVQLLNGDPVQTDLDIRAFGVGYGYSFWRSRRLEIAATFAVHEIDISARERVQTATRHVDQREDQAGPFPTLGLDATWVASRRFYFEGRAQYLKLAVDHMTASLGEYEFNALYRFRPNLSVALGVQAVHAMLVSRQRANSGRFDFDSKGPQLLVRLAF
ncbi:MAG: hypothetical protein KGL34_06640 [Gammaproteobacteria bacterium]|nr:hypothetical protein [Gammaproteobacteria bacterium]